MNDDIKRALEAIYAVKDNNADSENKKSVAVTESIRITKEGVEECWGDMMPNAATGQGEQMTVNITMPNKQISVTTDSADEIMNVLKLAGIAVGEPAEPEAPVVTMMPVAGAEEPEAAMVGAPGVTAPEGEAEESGEEESGEEESEEEESGEEEKKEESVEPQGPAVEEQDAFTMAAAAAAREGKTEFEFPQGSGKMHPVKIGKDTAHQMGESEEAVDEAVDGDIYDQVRAMAKDYYSKEENKPNFSQKNPSFMDKIKARVDRGVSAYNAAKQQNQQAGQQTESEETDEGQEEAARILQLAGLDESKFANAPANTEGEAKVYDKLPSAPGDGGGKPEYGTRQSNLGGENPMALKTLDLDMEESFQVAMGEYRKFVAENIMRKEGVTKK